jgi:hypothetical protein
MNNGGLLILLVKVEVADIATTHRNDERLTGRELAEADEKAPAWHE